MSRTTFSRRNRTQTTSATLAVARPAARRTRHLIPDLPQPDVPIFAVLSSTAIRQQIEALYDRAQAISDDAGAENRDLTDDERTEIDGILGVGKPGDAGHKPGQIDALHADLARVERLEALAAQIAAQRAAGNASGDGGGRLPAQRGTGTAAPPPDEPRVNRVRIPVAAQYRYGRLRAYTGPQAERSAYLAGQFFLAALFRNQRAQQWCRDFGVDYRITAALGEGSDPTGGVLVPVEVEQAIIDLRETYGVFRRRAKVVAMARDTKTQPVRDSGITAAWVGESSLIGEGDKAWRNLNLTARKLAALTRYSAELGEDATVSIGDDLTREFSYAFAVAEDEAGFNGDGTATYAGQVGLKNALAAGSAFITATGNTSFGTLDLADFTGALGLLPEYPGMQPCWFISKPGYWNSMVRLMSAAGGTTWEKTAEGQVVPMFLGYPVEYTHVLHKGLTTATSTIIAFVGDLSLAAVLGNRRGLTIQISDQRYFEYDQLGIKGTERCTVAVVQPGTSTAAGPMIAIKTASS